MSERNSLPLVHITDLYHPPQDPDDQFDLATVLALPELDLKAVLFDITQKFTEPAPAGWDLSRDPGIVTVAQAGFLIGRTIPVAVGPREPLRSETDDVSDRPATEQRAIEMLLQVLVDSPQPVAISVVGSARILAAAYLRAPEVVRAGVTGVWINAGSTSHGEHEWNVMLDTTAYRILWHSGLPIRWFPCATENGAFDPEPARGTHWAATHGELLRGLPPPWRGWFTYGLSGSARGDVIGALNEIGTGPVWDNLQPSKRSMWSTGSLAMLAGRVLARTDQGWRFVSAGRPEELSWEVWPWRLDPIKTSLMANSHVQWEVTTADSPHHLFGRKAGSAYSAAMAEALNALLVDGLP
jgi:pyrimidine-specific ribonucleoside hydrolase